ncbi:ABC transporter ATP-binding protein [Pseudoduganella albidiflava]|uniref:ABC transporter ATP-binding protein n=1 Tax=Pseudoduganella albidiflava TaxID=321983 RepID=A0A411WYN5_9BURK|nr:ABC transporter ATP-binding protein [Pseudoduganella albidiflava]QBI01819.1 ABC transporter ATP-binding protein [Pseudoduganella albidiflava]GGY39521.1 aliphatic sulfonates import ATP-binding protein SsuB 1 [Pseudoduganella albidiflava]
MQILPLNLVGAVRRSGSPAPADEQAGPQHAAAGVAVRAAAVTKRFGQNVILDGLDLEIRPGEFVALLGRSGCGKTTLLRTLAGLDGITSGSLQVPRALAAAFQEPRLMPWKRAWRNVTLGLRIPQARERAREALAEVGLAHRENAWPATLSGGEAQRVALARALVREPQLLLLDDPFAALDALTRIRMHRLILQLWARHRPAVLLVTHDVDEAILLADRVLVLEQGRFVADIAVREARPRSAERHGFQQLRARLLHLLGVEADEPADPAAGAGAEPELHYAHH